MAKRNIRAFHFLFQEDVFAGFLIVYEDLDSRTKIAPLSPEEYLIPNDY